MCVKRKKEKPRKIKSVGISEESEYIFTFIS